MILKIKLGSGFRGLDHYVTSKADAFILDTNMGGTTSRERASEVAGLRSAKTDLKKAVGHLVLSHDPALPDLTHDQWRTAIAIAREGHDLRDAPYCAVLHTGADHRHVHVFFLRVRPSDNSVVSDSHSYRKNESAARLIEQELGLPPPSRVVKEEKVGDRKRVENAVRRSSRKQESQGENHMENSELSRLTFDALASSMEVSTFINQLAVRGVQCEWSANQTGLKLRPTGATTWLKGSSVSRELSAAKILASLQRNAELVQAAEAAGAKVASTANTLSPKLTVARMLRQEAINEATPPDGTSRALPSEAHAQCFEAKHPLNFLASAQSSPTALPSHLDDENAEKKKRRQQEEHEQELQAELRKLSIDQLLDLKSNRVSDLFLSAAVLERLMNLMLKILTLGAVSRENTISNAVDARQRLADASTQELARRRRTPEGAKARREALASEASALESRDQKLVIRERDHSSARRSIESSSDSPATYEARRREWTWVCDQDQIKAGLPTLSTQKIETNEAEAEVVAAKADRPVSIGLFVSRATRAEIESANQLRGERLVAARKRRNKAKDVMREFLDRIDFAIATQNARRIAAASDEVRNDNAEKFAVGQELRATKGELSKLDKHIRLEQRDANLAAMRGVQNPLTPEEIEDEEGQAAESERLRNLLDRYKE